MDRKLYKLPFQQTRIPQWICPTCEKSILRLIKNTFVYYETVQSKMKHNYDFEPEWSPDWIRYIYSCQLICSNSSCEEIVASSGVGFVDVDSEYDNEGHPVDRFNDYFQPKYFQPNLKLFAYPKGTPNEVGDEIEQSF